MAGRKRKGIGMTDPAVEIHLEGFQTFAERVSIPLSRLTFLFGPNSAGKSAFEDAFGILGSLFNPSDGKLFDDEPYDRFPALSKHWRRIEGGLSRYVYQYSDDGDTGYADRLVLGLYYPIQVSPKVDLLGNSHTLSHTNAKNNKQYMANVDIVFRDIE